MRSVRALPLKISRILRPWGGRASALVVSLVLPADTEVDWLNDLVEGCGDRAREAGAGLVGGDLSSGDQLVIAVTAMGWCPHGVVVRSGAQPGDVLAVAGTLGRSAAGLAALSSGKVPPAPRALSFPHRFARRFPFSVPLSLRWRRGCTQPWRGCTP